MTKHRTFLTLVVAVAALGAAALVAVPAAAQQGSGAMMQGQGKGPGAMMQGEATENRETRRERRMRRWVERRLALLDTDGDGKVSAAEISAEQKRLFTAADVNGDGKLSVEEFRRRGRWFFQLRTLTFYDLLDANGDGQITENEITNPSQRWLKRHDVNSSGALEADELASSGHRHGRRFGRR